MASIDSFLATALVPFWLLIALTGTLLVLRLFRQRDRAQQLLRHAVDSMHDGFVLYDASDRLVMWNDRARGFYAPEVRIMKPGVRFEDIIRAEMKSGHFRDTEGQEEAWIQRRLHDHRNALGVAQQCLSDGRCIKIAEDKTPEGFTVSLIVDITELKQAQHAAERADRAKSDLLSTISHELRTPLTVVMGHASMLAQAGMLPQAARIEAALDDVDTPPGELREAVAGFFAAVAAQGAKIRGSSKHLVDLVSEILDLARIESGKLKVAPDWLDAGQVVAETLDDFRQRAGEKSIALVQEVEPTAVHADPLRLKQILYNLIGNAMKFTHAGTISVRGHADDAGVHFAIEDTGCGIDAENLPLIFDSFHQVDSSDTREHRGSGLGLALTKNLVELHGGRIGVTSTPGVGSRFTVFLPHPAGDDAERGTDLRQDRATAA